MDETHVSLLEASPLAAVVIDAGERIVAANAPARTLLGERILTRHYITALRQPGLLDAIEGVLSGREARTEALFLPGGAQGETTYRVVAARVRLPQETGLLLTFIDISDVQQAEQMRRDFVANVSHELRTPLTALLGFIETLRGAARDDPAARERFLGIMEREAARMNRLVRDLLSLNRVESEERMRPRTRADLAAIARSSLQSMRPIAEERGITLMGEGTGGEVTVPGDADQIAQILSNLLENAIKYGRANGRVTVSLETRAREPAVRGPAAVLEVADDGEGIDSLHIPRLTERFYRVDSHRSRELGGTGLGLAIVKHIVNRHRGRLRIDSAPGQGSRFTVILPAE